MFTFPMVRKLYRYTIGPDGPVRSVAVRKIYRTVPAPSSQTPKRRVVQPVHSLCCQENTKMHGLLGTDCTQASSFGCISPEGLSYCLGVHGALSAPRHQSIASCRLFGLSGGKGTHRCMTYIGSTVSIQASLCGCTRPETANRLILHIAAYVMPCQHPNTKASCGAVYSLSQLARGHADAWPAWLRLHTVIVVWVH